MAKTITITAEDGREYTLKFTRRTIKRMEDRGFDPTKFESMPMTVAYDLFEGAFQACHPGIKRDTVDELFEQIGDLTGLVEDLTELYQDPYNAETKGEIKRTRNW